MPLSFNEFRKQYPGLPTEAIIATADRLDQRYRQNKADSDMLEIMISNLELRQPNTGVVNSALENMKTTLKGIRESGRWEDASLLVQQASKEFATNKVVQGAIKDKQKFDADNAAMQARVGAKENGITQDDYETWYAYNTTKNNKQIEYDATTNSYKNMWSSNSVPKYIDMTTKVRDFLDKMNENQLADMKLKRSGGGYFVAGTTKEISTEEAMLIATQYMKNDQEMQDRLKWESFKDDYRNFSYIDANGDIQMRDITIDDFARFGYTIDKNRGKLTVPIINPKTGEQVKDKKGNLMFEDVKENEFLSTNGVLDITKFKNLYHNLRHNRAIMDYATPGVKWVDFVQQESKFYEDWMSKMATQYDYDKKLYDYKQPHSTYIPDILLANPGTHTISQQTFKGLFPNGTADLKSSVLSFGQNNALGNTFEALRNSGMDGKTVVPAVNRINKIYKQYTGNDLKNLSFNEVKDAYFRALGEIRNYKKNQSIGKDVSFIDKFKAAIGAGKEAISYIYTNSGEIYDYEKTQEFVRALGEIMPLYNKLGEDGIKQTIGAVADLTEDEAVSIGKMAVLAQLPYSNFQGAAANNFHKGVDGKMFVSGVGFISNSALKNSGFTDNDIKAINRYSEATMGFKVFVPTDEKKAAGESGSTDLEYQVNLNIQHGTSFGAMVDVDAAHGIKTGTNPQYGRYQNAIMLNAGLTNTMMKLENTRKTYGEIIITTPSNNKMKVSDFIESMSNSIEKDFGSRDVKFENMNAFNQVLEYIDNQLIRNNAK